MLSFATLLWLSAMSKLIVTDPDLSAEHPYDEGHVRLNMALL
jgi:hypothetical protein